MARVATDSTLPPQAAFHHAVLRHLTRHPDGDRRQNIHEAIPDLLHLSETQRTERLANLPHLRYRHRSGWALSMLKAAGYVDNPIPEIWRITDRGRELLARYPDGFDEETGRRVIREGRGNAQGHDVTGGAAPAVVDTAAQTPDERIDGALEEIRGAVARQLLERIAQAPPTFFEGLVLDLLHALGYGTNPIIGFSACPRSMMTTSMRTNHLNDNRGTEGETRFGVRSLSGSRSCYQDLDSETGRAYRCSMRAGPIIETFRKLPPAEKVRLVQQLWDEIAEEAAHLPLTESQRRLLDERIDHHEANPDDVEPWENVRADILRKLCLP
jgi:putative addiction module component (TIGR02574 family)